MDAMDTAIRTALIFVALAAFASPASATFGGSNGGIGFAQRTITGDSVEPPVEHTRLAARHVFGASERVLLDCQLTGGLPSGGNCAGTSYRSPSYSRDGSRIVFDAGERIGVMAADGSGLSLQPAVTADDGDPAFAPDGRRIVFTGTNDRGTTDVYVRRLGDPAQLIIHDAGEPTWSSRDVIAYVRSGNVYVARPGGLHRRFVTSGVSPDWSPDGRRLLFVRPLARLTFDAPIGRMYVAGAHGEGLRRIGPRADASRPVWSPQGNWIAYEALEAGILAKRLDSSEPAHEIAPSQSSGESGSVASFDPAWRPFPR
jgi:dipeptidyl aminopeptidase/acylaminoacyl peptidase